MYNDNYTWNWDEEDECGEPEPEPLYTFEHKGYTVEVWPDDAAESPRDWDGNVTYLVLYHPRYNLGDALSKPVYTNDLAGWMDATMAEKGGRNPIIIPVTMIDHGSVSLHAHADVTQFLPGMHWDMSLVGYAVINRERARELHAWGRITRAREAALIAEAKAEIEEYGQYINGECYGYVIKDPNGEEVDSCFGFIGNDWLEKEAKGIIDSLA